MGVGLLEGVPVGVGEEVCEADEVAVPVGDCDVLSVPVLDEVGGELDDLVAVAELLEVAVPDDVEVAAAEAVLVLEAP